MKKSILALTLSLLSTQAFAGEFFECGGFADVDEYRAGIDVEAGTAGFFDNDATSKLTLKSKSVRKGQEIMIFEGKEASYAGSLRLIFNRTDKSAVMISIDDDSGDTSEIGHAPCQLAKPWKY